MATIIICINSDEIINQSIVVINYYERNSLFKNCFKSFSFD